MKTILKGLISALSTLSVIFLISTLAVSIYFYGLVKGYNQGANETYNAFLQAQTSSPNSTPPPNLPTPEPIVITQTPTKKTYPTWTGPQLWEQVNKRRQELGVNGLSNKAELCTIASIRLNQLLDLGDLDGHEGFGKLEDEREDLVWIFEKYNLSEFLVSGAETPARAVELWENTLGHKKLLTGGEYVWGCVYAQNGFAVAITAF